MVLDTRHQLRSGFSPNPVWRGSTIGRMLRNAAYKGEYVAWRRMAVYTTERDPVSGDLNHKKHDVPRPAHDDALIPLPADIVPPLVDEQTWAQVQQALEQHKHDDHHQRTTDFDRPSQTLLANGFATCGLLRP
jgi:hypothetical protein